MAPFTYSVDRLQAFIPLPSMGYTDWASAFFPPGRLMRAASHKNALDAAHSTSREFLQKKCHVRFAFCGYESRLVKSTESLIITVLSLFLATASRLMIFGVNTSAWFNNSPDPTTTILAGAVTV